MGKNKLKKFAEMETFSNVFQPPYEPMAGHWHERYFRNDHPIVLELGCGRGEYTVGMARKYPEKNFIGVDIKGARMWAGAKEAEQEGLRNVAFLRTNIEFIETFFAANEVDEVWITFCDPGRIRFLAFMNSMAQPSLIRCPLSSIGALSSMPLSPSSSLV